MTNQVAVFLCGWIPDSQFIKIIGTDYVFPRNEVLVQLYEIEIIGFYMVEWY